MLNEFGPHNTTFHPSIFTGLRTGDMLNVITESGVITMVWDAVAQVARRVPEGTVPGTGQQAYYIRSTPAGGKSFALELQRIALAQLYDQLYEKLVRPQVNVIIDEMYKQRPNKGPQGHIEPWKRRGRRRK